MVFFGTLILCQIESATIKKRRITGMMRQISRARLVQATRARVLLLRYLRPAMIIKLREVSDFPLARLCSGNYNVSKSINCAS